MVLTLPYKSIPRLIFHGFSKAGILHFKESLSIPDKSNITQISINKEFPWKIFMMNVVAMAVFTIVVLSSLYAGYLNPELRTTSSTLSGIINGLSTILMFIFIDPYLSAMTDDVILGKKTEAYFRQLIVYMIIARFIGTLLAQLLFFPAASFIAFIGGKI